MPRLVYLTGWALVLVAGAFVLTHDLLGPWPRVTEANLQRVKAKMTYGEVEDLLGSPAGFERRDRGQMEALIRTAAADMRTRNGGFVSCSWESEAGVAKVYFGLDGRVDSVRWTPADRPHIPTTWPASAPGSGG